MLMTVPPEASLTPAWQTAPAALTLPPGEVHVWRAGLDVAPEALGRLQQTLSADEQARAERFYFPHDRDRYAAGRGILRALLARYLGTPAGDLRFVSNAQGKPALEPGKGSEDLRFNLSHSRGFALFAFTLRREVGVDVEFIRPALRDDRLAERFFSPQEAAALRAAPASEQNEAFFNCWTRKEAYIKGRGGGLSISLSSFSVSLAPASMANQPITSHDGFDASRWSLRGLDPGGGYVAAVAAEGGDWSLALWQWT
jgi:4'-phosphopantetheinyl transferase